MTSMQMRNRWTQTTSVLIAKILRMVVENGIAVAERREKPHSVQQLNALRAALLQDAFFDIQHRPEELREFRTNPRGIVWMDLVVLLSKLMRVAMRREPLGEDFMAERIAVRNEVLDLPFFDRSKPPSLHPFVLDEPEDEGVYC